MSPEPPSKQAPRVVMRSRGAPPTTVCQVPSADCASYATWPIRAAGSGKPGGRAGVVGSGVVGSGVVSVGSGVATSVGVASLVGVASSVGVAWADAVLVALIREASGCGDPSAQPARRP